MWEIVSVARAKGYVVSDDTVEHQVARTRIMQDYRASTLIDFERGQPLEVDSMFLEPLRQARLAGVPTPRLEALCHLLTALDARNPGQAP
jgi:2-dehydropantoate 2-reductase